MKRCTKCKAEKPKDAFGKNRGRTDGLQSWCKPCNAVAIRAWWQSPRGIRVRKDLNLKYFYGLSIEQFEAMVIAIGGICPGCGTTPKRLCVDHCHRTGRIRGLLCDNCNRALGSAKDSPATLRRLATYLERTGGEE